MKILILGGGGMVGQKLASKIAAEGLKGKSVNELILHDLVQSRTPEIMTGGQDNAKIKTLTGNITDQSEAERIASLRADLIFHLAAVVSADAERNFDKGWDVNARGSWNLLDALKKEIRESAGEYRPRLIFSSSIAVFGPPFPEKIGDEFHCSPQTSYGSQKAVTEQLISDYSRKKIIDGISIRLPTVCVRPGKPNLAASSFFSGIIREPLNGKEAILPVSTSVRHWYASPRSAVGFLLHAALLDTSKLQGRRSITMPGVSCTVGEQIEALRAIAGEKAVNKIRHEPDELIASIVKSWPRNFNPARALNLGFSAEQDFEEIIRTYIEDDLPKN